MKGVVNRERIMGMRLDEWGCGGEGGMMWGGDNEGGGVVIGRNEMKVIRGGRGEDEGGWGVIERVRGDKVRIRILVEEFEERVGLEGEGRGEGVVVVLGVKGNECGVGLGKNGLKVEVVEEMGWR